MYIIPKFLGYLMGLLNRYPVRNILKQFAQSAVMSRTPYIAAQVLKAQDARFSLMSENIADDGIVRRYRDDGGQMRTMVSKCTSAPSN